jgi:hypothetical protein
LQSGLTIPIDEQCIVLADDISMSSDFETEAMEIYGFDCGGFQIKVTASDAADGVIMPQFSVDGECWCDYLESDDAKKTSIGDFCCMFEFPNFCFRYVRLKFTANSVSMGTLRCLSYAKRQVAR